MPGHSTKVLAGAVETNRRSRGKKAFKLFLYISLLKKNKKPKQKKKKKPCLNENFECTF